MRFILILVGLLFAISGHSQINIPSIVGNVKQIVQNDTVISHEVWKGTYEVVNDRISDPIQLINDIEFQLKERIPNKFPHNKIKYRAFANCNQIGVQGYHSNPVSKHRTTIEIEGQKIDLCFYVLDWDREVNEVELNFIVTVLRYWY